MTTYRLDVGGWVPHVTEPDKWKKYFAAQVAGRPVPKMSPIKDNVVNRREPVKVQLVSGVQDAVDRANAELMHIKDAELSKHDSVQSNVKASTTKKKKKTTANCKKQTVKVKRLKAAANKTKKNKKSKSQSFTTTAKSTLKRKKKANHRKNQKTHTNTSKKTRQFVNAVLPKDVWGPAKWG